MRFICQFTPNHFSCYKAHMLTTQEIQEKKCVSDVAVPRKSFINKIKITAFIKKNKKKSKHIIYRLHT